MSYRRRGYDPKPKDPGECNPANSEQPAGQALPDGPSTCFLELTHACNNRCPGCANNEFIADFNTRTLKSGFHHRPLNGSEWDRILDRLGPFVTCINLSGGEPTVHPDFEVIAASIEGRGIDFFLFTNARWRDPERLVSFLSSLSRFRGLLISLHGALPETHETFSGVSGSFQETVANIARAARAGLSVSTSTVITHQNVPELEAIAALSHELGADDTVFNRYLIPLIREEQVVSGGTLRQMVPTRAELREAVQAVERLRETLGKTFHVRHGPCIPQCFTPSSSQGCSAGETFFVVDPWGNVKPCLHTTLLCGNLLEQDVMTIWNGQSLEYWRGMVPSGCSGCSALSQCRTGCRAMALTSGLGHDPLMNIPLS